MEEDKKYEQKSENSDEKLRLSDVIQQGGQLFCYNCLTWHTNIDYEGYCCQSCLDGIVAK